MFRSRKRAAMVTIFRLLATLLFLEAIAATVHSHRNPLFQANTPSSNQSCPNGCQCKTSPDTFDIEADCPDAGLTSVPLFPANLTVVNLSENDISEIGPYDLSIYPRLSKVTIIECGLKQIDPNAFVGTQLSFFKVEYNELVTYANINFPDTLTTLNAGYNKLSSGVFKTSPPNLQTLTLDGNQALADIGNLAPSPIKSLQLNGCNFTTIPTAIPSVSRLAMERNSVTSLATAGVWSNVQILVMNTCMIDDISNLATAFPSAEIVDFAKNSMSGNAFEGSPFVGTVNVTELELANNRLNDLPQTAFDGLNRLTYLSLTSNGITTVPDLSLLPQLLNLDLSTNDIFDLSTTSLPDSTQTLSIVSNPRLQNLPHKANGLMNLDVSNCGFTNIPDLSSAPTLLSLTISGNNFQDKINAGDFGSTNLREFTCSNCGLTDVDNTTFITMTRLESVDLSTNFLQIPRSGWFSQLPNIAYVHLASNPWACDCHALPYKNLVVKTNDSTGSSPFRLTVLCESPPSLSDVYLDDVSASTLFDFGSCPAAPTVNPFPTSVSVLCPAGCQCLDGGNDIVCTDGTLTEVPSNIPRACQSLTLDNNKISQVSNSDFSYLTNLKEISMKNNLLTDLGDSTWSDNHELLTLYFTNNSITTFNQATFPNSMTTLDLSHNCLAELTSFQGFLYMKELTNLYLHHNKITSIAGSGVWTRSGVTTLRLDNNLLTTIPDLTEINQIVQSLNLTGNQIGSRAEQSWTPRAILSRLRYLYLSLNEISSLPSYFFANAPLLTTLWLDGNRLTGFTKGDFDNAAELVLLNLDNNQIATLPTSLFQNCRSLEKLTMANNQMVDLTAIFLLPKLQTLDLSYNRISTIGQATSVFNTVQDLTLSGNPLTALSFQVYNWIQQQTNLLTLELCSCELTSTPKNLPNTIVELVLGHNQISMVESTDLSTFTNLQRICYSNNRLSAIADDGFDNNQMLLNLDIDNNELKTPKVRWFSNLQSLTSIDWTTNPWVCDCHAVPFAVFLDYTKNSHLSSVLGHTLKCTDSSFDGEYIDDVSIKLLDSKGDCVSPTGTIPVPTSTVGGSTDIRFAYCALIMSLVLR